MVSWLQLKLVIAGRVAGDKVASDQCDQVITTQVRPRSRPEGRKLETALSLPPPPTQDKR